jgi:hypothetical protein
VDNEARAAAGSEGAPKLPLVHTRLMAKAVIAGEP